MSELISGKKAKLAWANGEKLQWRDDEFTKWIDLSDKCRLEIFHEMEFRVKPSNIKINGIEVPKSANESEYNGGLIWVLCGTDTREYTSLALDESDDLPAYWWKSEEEIKQVVAALRSVFNES